MADDGLSAYERQRLENIAKNKKVLESLGLLSGSGLIQRNKGGGGAIQRKAKPREQRPVVMPRVREQRTVSARSAPERLDPGLERLRKLQEERKSAAEALAQRQARAQGLALLPSTGSSSTAPVALHRATNSIEPPPRLHLGISDEDVYAHFHRVPRGAFDSRAAPHSVGAAGAAAAAAATPTAAGRLAAGGAASPGTAASAAADAAAPATDADAPAAAAAAAAPVEAAAALDNAPADGPLGMDLPSCPECEGFSRALPRPPGQTRQRFQCKRPRYAHPLPTAYSLLTTAHSLLPTAHCPLPTPY